MSKDNKSGLKKGLTSYGDPGFSLFLRKAFIKAMGYSDDALTRPSSASPTPIATTIPATATFRSSSRLRSAV
jgi:hypothetical protein